MSRCLSTRYPPAVGAQRGRHISGLGRNSVRHQVQHLSSTSAATGVQTCLLCASSGSAAAARPCYCHRPLALQALRWSVRLHRWPPRVRRTHGSKHAYMKASRQASQAKRANMQALPHLLPTRPPQAALPPAPGCLPARKMRRPGELPEPLRRAGALPAFVGPANLKAPAAPWSFPAAECHSHAAPRYTTAVSLA